MKIRSRSIRVMFLGLISIWAGLSGPGCDNPGGRPWPLNRAKLNRGVVLIKGEDAHVIVDQEHDMARFTGSEAEAVADLTQGQLIVVTNHGGLIGLVVNVENGDTGTWVDVIDVPLTMVFEELHFHAEDIGPSSYTYPLVGPGMIQPAAAPTITLDASLQLLNPDIYFGIDDVNVDLDIEPPGMECTGNPLPSCHTECSGDWRPWTWHCETECDPPTLSCEFWGPYVSYYLTSVEASMRFNIQLEAVLTGGLSYSKSISVFPEQRRFVGTVMGIPVNAVFQFPLGCDVGVNSAQTFTYYSYNEYAFEAGIEYDGRWHNIWNESKFTDAGGTFASEQSVGVECYFKPTFYLEFANLAGPYVDVGPYGAFDITVYPEAKAQVTAGIKVHVGGKVETLGVTWLDFSTTVYDWENVLWESKPDCAEDETTCFDPYSYRTCENNDLDPYLEWSNVPTACPPGGRCRLPSGEAELDYECSVCGNGAIETGEFCDTAPVACKIGCYDGTRTCHADCLDAAACNIGSQLCGDGTRQGCEVCDLNKKRCRTADSCYFGSSTCLANCAGYGASCSLDGQGCGNNVLEGCEICEQNDTRGCWTANYAGVKHCLSGCNGFASACDIGSQRCGNGLVEGRELCEPGFPAPCNDGCYFGEVDCRADCLDVQGSCDTGTQACGNGTREGCEVCEPGQTQVCNTPMYQGLQSCLTNCTGYAAACDIGSQRCGNNLQEGNEICDGSVNTPCQDPVWLYHGVHDCRGDCLGYQTCNLTESCGDLTLNGNETCEDTDPTNGSVDLGCSPTTPNCAGCASCSADVCGDGVPGFTEVCDDGALNGMGEGICLSSCQGIQTCGDSLPNGTESCDDGVLNGTGNGYCLATCTGIQDCGDDVPNGTETCDDGILNGTGNGYCLTTCQATQTCGDGVQNGTEGCDDHNTNNCDGCKSDCARPDKVCGDLIIDSACGEQCEDGNLNDCGDACTNGCRFRTGCGDGAQCATEACDDGNLTAGDGCSKICLDEDIYCNPASVGSQSTAGNARGLAAFGNYAFVTESQYGLRIVNIADPAHPVFVKSVDTPGVAAGVALSADGAYAYVADNGGGLRVISIADPPNAVEVGSYIYPGGGSPVDVRVSGNYAYVANANSGLLIVNVTNPAAPSLAGFLADSLVKSLDVKGTFAYLDANGLKIVDCINPAAPVQTAYFSGVWGCRQPAVMGNYVYMAGGYGSTGNGMVVINVSDPANPSLVTHLNSGMYSYGVTAKDNYVYLAMNMFIEVYDMTNPAAPVMAGEILSGTRAQMYVAGALLYSSPGFGTGFGIYTDLPAYCPTTCGNTQVEYPEVCDDGDNLDTIPCNWNCTIQALP